MKTKTEICLCFCISLWVWPVNVGGLAGDEGPTIEALEGVIYH